MNLAQVVGSLVRRPERWFVDGEALVRCHIRAELSKVDDPEGILRPTVVVEVMGRDSAATQLWGSRPGERFFVSGRLSFIDRGPAIGPEPSSVLINTQTAWQCESSVSNGNDDTFLLLTGTVRDRASAQLPHGIRRTQFLLAKNLALSSPFPNPDSHSIVTSLSPELLRRTGGGLVLGESVTLRGELVTTDDSIGRNGSTHVQFLAIEVKEPVSEDALVQRPPGCRADQLATTTVHGSRRRKQGRPSWPPRKAPEI